MVSTQSVLKKGASFVATATRATDKESKDLERG